MDGNPTSRRRVTSLDTIKGLAVDQLASGGPDAVSLNAIAASLGLTGPAIYRYVASRRELINMVLRDAYVEFGRALDDGVARKRTPETALRGSAQAYRRWSTEHPVRYGLIMGGVAETDLDADTAAHAWECFSVLLGTVEQLLPGAPATVHLDAAVHGWLRLHGFVSLEIAGLLATVGASPDRIFRAEVDAFLSEVAVVHQARRQRSR